MQPLSDADIRSSFINASKGDVKRMTLPPDLAATKWDDLDFLGWTDPKVPNRSYIVAPEAESLVGIMLRSTVGGRRTQMCGICLTTHTGGGVSLFSARKAGVAGRDGNTVGMYMCTDLMCSLYARGKKIPTLGNRYREELQVDDKVGRLVENLAAFIANIRG
ncbi:FBP domain-containing protein [Skermania sp. ID1734]|uniref:FBP domain-containing protein n=1 Tax=Skermania sp. ID1734 TaxID=2597516 RepID=UPI00117F11A5|nr:FBP domain-containing protein [Skermania sp. ID1734]TSE00499.1 FBP domain-containing protein [Skermania sp. ID1734]